RRIAIPEELRILRTNHGPVGTAGLSPKKRPIAKAPGIEKLPDAGMPGHAMGLVAGENRGGNARQVIPLSGLCPGLALGSARCDPRQPTAMSSSLAVLLPRVIVDCAAPAFRANFAAAERRAGFANRFEIGHGKLRITVTSKDTVPSELLIGTVKGPKGKHSFGVKISICPSRTSVTYTSKVHTHTPGLIS